MRPLPCPSGREKEVTELDAEAVSVSPLPSSMLGSSAPRPLAGRLGGSQPCPGSLWESRLFLVGHQREHAQHRSSLHLIHTKPFYKESRTGCSQASGERGTRPLGPRLQGERSHRASLVLPASLPRPPLAAPGPRSQVPPRGELASGPRPTQSPWQSPEERDRSRELKALLGSSFPLCLREAGCA